MSNRKQIETAKTQGYGVTTVDIDSLTLSEPFDPLKILMERKKRKEHSYRKWKHRKPRKRLFIDEYHLLMDKPDFCSRVGMAHALVLPEKLDDKSVLITDPKNDKI